MTKPQFRVGGAGKSKFTIGATPHGASLDLASEVTHRNALP
jgi:hypothetical protein